MSRAQASVDQALVAQIADVRVNETIASVPRRSSRRVSSVTRCPSRLFLPRAPSPAMDIREYALESLA